MVRRGCLLIVVAVAAVACGGGDTSRPSGDGTGSNQLPNLSLVPVVDTSLHTVPLEDVVFDTFDGAFQRLSDSTEQLQVQLRDRIQPVYLPWYIEAAEASQWVNDGDRVVGIEVGGQAYAYVVRMLNFREIVNDVLDGTPIAVTYCPLCASGVVYDRRLNGETLLFGNTSALFDNDMVMFDHQTGSYWHQLSGRAIVGTLAGEELTPIPSTIATFGEWRNIHPGTLVLANTLPQAAASPDTLERVRSSVNQGRFFFPLTGEAANDDRLRLGTDVLLLRVSGQWKAYPLAEAFIQAINDELGGVPIVVLAKGASAAAFFATVDGEVLRFKLEEPFPGRELRFRDEQTNTIWGLDGTGSDGPLSGKRLEQIPSRRAFWFSVAGSYPGVDVYTR